jgi:CBS domain-containing protein
MLLGLADEGEAVFTRSVADLMSADVLALTQDAEVNDVMALMTERRKRHFPVIEDGVLVGIVSIGDIVKHKIAEAEQEARALKAYIAG